MKAAVIHEFGDVDVLKYEDIETPKPGPSQVLVKVLAAGVNRFDHYITPLALAPSFALRSLHLPGTYAQYIDVPARWLVKDTSGLTLGGLAKPPMVRLMGTGPDGSQRLFACNRCRGCYLLYSR
jgi:NADPH:quinone reductase-like Zn-dependent oxidoreductase